MPKLSSDPVHGQILRKKKPQNFLGQPHGCGEFITHDFSCACAIDIIMIRAGSSPRCGEIYIHSPGRYDGCHSDTAAADSYFGSACRVGASSAVVRVGGWAVPDTISDRGSTVHNKRSIAAARDEPPTCATKFRRDHNSGVNRTVDAVIFPRSPKSPFLRDISTTYDF